MKWLNQKMCFLSLCLVVTLILAPYTVTASDVTTAGENTTNPVEDATQVSPDEAVPDTPTAADNETTTSASDISSTNSTSSEQATSDLATTAVSEETSTVAGTSDPGTTGETTEGDCIEATLPNILGMGKCLGDDLNLCAAGKTVLPGLLSLINCTVIGVIQNLSVKNALLTIKDLIFAVIQKVFSTNLGIVEAAFSGQQRTSDNITDNACLGEIKIGFPNSLGKCLNDTLKLCANGDIVDTAIIDSLVSAVTCLLTDLITTNPGDLLRQLLCDISRALEALTGAIFLGQTVQNIITNALCTKES